MAAAIVVTCPACRKQLKVPAEFQGKKVRCKCGSTLRVGSAAPKKAAAPQAAAPKAAAPDEELQYAFKPDEGGPVTVPQSEAGSQPAAPKRFLDDDDDANPYDLTHLDDAARCPYCAKAMDPPDAVICLHCGYNNQTRQMVTTKVVYETTFGDWCKWLGPGILCVISAVALLAGDAYFCFGAGWWDGMDESMGSQSFSRGIRVWVSVMVLWVCWFCAKFAFRRLILNPRPPEVEIKK